MSAVAFRVLESFPDRRGFTSTVCLCERCANDPQARSRCGVELAARNEPQPPPCKCNQCDAGREDDQ